MRFFLLMAGPGNKNEILEALVQDSRSNRLIDKHTGDFINPRPRPAVLR